MATNSLDHNSPFLPYCAAEIADVVLMHDRRLLLYGPPGVGKSTLAAQLARVLVAAGRNCYCICADPGSPAFGLPGAVSLGAWQADGWQVCAYEALCSLDAGRFRLPLVTAVRRLAQPLVDGVLLIDSPGVVRGIAGRELLQGLCEAVTADAVLVLTAAEREPPLFDDLRALAADIYVVHAAEEARRPGKRARARWRTECWDAYLRDSSEQSIELDRVNLTGTPPPLGEASAWTGRQIALLQRNRTQTMAEVVRFQDNQLTVRVPAESTSFDSLLVRDAQRSIAGLMETATPFVVERLEYLPPPDMTVPFPVSGGPRVVGRIGSVDICLVNGVFGDPMLHLRLRHQRRSLLFDLGDGTRLPARIAHQVTDVFISHAHMDHIGGFLWLLRSRIGNFPPCRLYGPPGLARHIEGFLQGILWDRVAEYGPTFEVAELHADRLRRFRLQAGHTGCELLDEVKVQEGVVLQETGFCIRAELLDHHTQVVAYAFEPVKEINIRKDRLKARGLEPGPWLAELKQHLLTKEEAALVQLPDGTAADVATLAKDLVLITPAKKMVYATDLADTPDNRQRLQALARYAHTFFCEACFIESDVEQAARTGHLTTRACGEIAMAAEVARLVPFHFSQRYTDKPQQIYNEVHNVCSRLVMPKSMLFFEVAVAPGSETVFASD
ncbi:MAG: hypothetical protein GQ532_17725 [Methylomarinum sp.]|nr:hypothetical protein [Methylomarinum sp.]